MIVLPLLCNPARTQRLPLPYWRGLSFDEGDMGQGEASIDIPMDYCPAQSSFFSNPYGWSLDVLLIDPGLGSRTVWSGPVVEFSDTRGPDGVWIRNLSFEAFIFHFLRRRLAVENNYIPWQNYSGSLSWVQIASKVLLSKLDIAPTFVVGRGNAYPSTRADWGDWTVTVRGFSTTHPVHQGDTGKYLWPIESGNTFWEMMADICAKAGLRLVITETAAGVFELDVRNKIYTETFDGGGWTPHAYDLTYDLSHSVVLSPLVGNARVIGRTETYRGLTNTYSARGKGQTTPSDFQYNAWNEDIASRVIYGRFEDGDTANGGSDNLPALVAKSELFLETRGLPVVTWQTEVGWMPPGFRPVLDWGRWHKVKVHDHKIAPTPTVLECVGWSGSCDGPGGEPQFEMHVGQPLLDWDGLYARGLARFGGFTGGGLDVRKAG